MLNYGPIWPDSKLTARKARNEYRCEGCKTTIRRGDTYYSEYRGGLDSIKRCACCVEQQRGKQCAQAT